MADRDYSELLRLSREERLALIELLWDSILAEQEPAPVTTEQLAEIQRRIKEHERNPSTAIPWEAVRALLEARFGER